MKKQIDVLTSILEDELYNHTNLLESYIRNNGQFSRVEESLRKLEALSTAIECMFREETRTCEDTKAHIQERHSMSMYASMEDRDAAVDKEFENV